MSIKPGIQRDEIPEERDRIASEVREILDRSSSGTLSPDDQAAYDERMSDLDALRDRDQRLAVLERHAAGGLGGERADPNAVPESMRRRDDVPQGRTDTHTAASRLLARGAPALGDELGAILARQVEGDPTTGSAERVLATATPEYASAWRKIAADPMGGQRSFTTAEAEAWARGEAYSMRLNLTDGAAAVPTHLDPTVMLSSDGVLDPFRELARVVLLTEGTNWNGVSSTGVTSRWAAEESEAEDDSPPMTPQPVETHKADSFVPLSLEALADMASVDSELRRLFVEAKAVHEGPAFVVGNGVGKPQGLLTGLAAAQTVDTAGSGAFAPGVDVPALIEAVPARFRANARFMGSLGILNTIEAAETTSGAKRFPGMDASPPILLRKPVTEHSEMSSTVSAGQHILVAGDFQAGYVVVDRSGFAIELVPHLFGSSGRPEGRRGYYAWWRVGGAPVVANAFRRLEVAA